MSLRYNFTAYAMYAALLCGNVAYAAGAPIGTALCTTLPKHGVPPIYFSLSDAGEPMRGHLERSDNGTLYPVRFRVSPGEVEMLCEMGYDVRTLPTSASPDGKLQTKGLVSQIPTSFTLLRLYGTLYADNYYTSASAPSGYTTQYAAFDVQPANFSVTSEHAVVTLFLDAAALGASPPALVGNGLILGDVSATTNGCGSAQAPSVPADNTQYEAFWSSGNYLWPGSCASTAFSDNTTHSLIVHASTGSWLWYQRVTGGTTHSPSAVYTLNQRPSFDASNGGIFFGVTNMVPGSGDFSLWFTNVTVGWF